MNVEGSERDRPLGSLLALATYYLRSIIGGAP